MKEKKMEMNEGTAAKIVDSLQKRNLSKEFVESVVRNDGKTRHTHTRRGGFLLLQREADGKIYESKNPFEST
ncbi:MAG TPA: hypothetical protein VEF35_07035 [Candidatus Bathyarchaeia archaeon]|nr:hypothetical protein [Candidatus Bathyarchaeia archaeon]